MLFDWPPFPQDSSVEAIFSVTDFVLARLLYDFSRVENRHIFVNVVILIALSQCLSISSCRKKGIELSMAAEMQNCLQRCNTACRDATLAAEMQH